MTDTVTHIAPMPSTVVDTIKAHDRIMLTVEATLAKQRVQMRPEWGLMLAFLGTEKLNAKEILRRTYYRGSAISMIVNRLHDERFIRCHDRETDRRTYDISLTPRGLQIADAIRRALGGDGE
jgi:DNA-binding MarR family transcriptional regulator